jgi:hypothetical protein
VTTDFCHEFHGLELKIGGMEEWGVLWYIGRLRRRPRYPEHGLLGWTDWDVTTDFCHEFHGLELKIGRMGGA